MRRYGLALWALWLTLTPLGMAWAYACACAGHLSLQCCSKRETVERACCQATAASCCSESGAPCTDCSGCQLERARAQPPALASKVLLDSPDWIVDAPALDELSRQHTLLPTIGLPTIRNHSPPLEPSAPRAPPLC